MAENGQSFFTFHTACPSEGGRGWLLTFSLNIANHTPDEGAWGLTPASEHHAWKGHRAPSHTSFGQTPSHGAAQSRHAWKVQSYCGSERGQREQFANIIRDYHKNAFLPQHLLQPSLVIKTLPLISLVWEVALEGRGLLLLFFLRHALLSDFCLALCCFHDFLISVYPAGPATTVLQDEPHSTYAAFCTYSSP